MIALRPYQQQAIDGIRAAVKAGHKRILALAPCRAGKTLLATAMITAAVQRGKRALFLAHRRGLVDQAFDKITRFGLPPDQVGMLMGSAAPRPAPVQVASIQMIDRRFYPEADLIFFDECHRALAPAFARVAEAYPNAVIVGLTATPVRSDGRGLGEMFSTMVQVAQPSTLVASGHLLEPEVWSVPLDMMPNLAGVGVRGGEYIERDLEQVMLAPGLVGSIVEHWQKRAGGRQTVAFGASVAHSKEIADRFNAAGVPAEHFDAETHDDARASLYARFASGALRVICNNSMVIEGWDSPQCKAVVWARPTLSPALWIQGACRALTPWDGHAVTPVVIDHTGSAQRHGLPTEDREWSLVGRQQRARDKDKLTVRTCPKCYAVFEATATCPRCGAVTVAPAGPRVPEEKDGELVRVEATGPEKRAEWERLCSVAARKGYKPGWVRYRYQARFGVLPIWSCEQRVNELRGATDGL